MGCDSPRRGLLHSLRYHVFGAQRIFSSGGMMSDRAYTDGATVERKIILALLEELRSDPTWTSSDVWALDHAVDLILQRATAFDFQAKEKLT